MPNKKIIMNLIGKIFGSSLHMISFNAGYNPIKTDVSLCFLHGLYIYMGPSQSIGTFLDKIFFQKKKKIKNECLF